MRNSVKWVIGVVVVAAIGVVLFNTLSNKGTYRPEDAIATVKAMGTVSVINDMVLMITPGDNNYVIVGANKDGVSKLKDKTVYIYGKMYKAGTPKVNELVIRGDIDVSRFDDKDFNIAPATEQLSEGIQRKVQDQVELRTRVLKKLDLEDSGFEVVTGKLHIIKTVLLRQAKESVGLMVVDKYGDQYVLAGQLKYPYKDYASLASANLDVVAVGYIQTPDPGLMPLLKTEPHFTFAVNGLYNNDEDLTDIVVRK